MKIFTDHSNNIPQNMYETRSVITGIAGLSLLAVCLLGFIEIEPRKD